MDIETLRSLQARIRSATGPDRDLDEAIYRIFSNRPPDRWPVLLPFFTTYPEGLGACVALLHERFPGCTWTRGRMGSINIYRSQTAFVPIGFGCDTTVLANDCLTFIDAIIAATIAQLEAVAVKQA